MNNNTRAISNDVRTNILLGIGALHDGLYASLPARRVGDWRGGSSFKVDIRRLVLSDR